MVPSSPNNILKSVWGHLKQDFATGLFLLVPIVVTYLILRLIFTTIDGVLRPLVAPPVAEALGWAIPGLGILALIVVVFIVGTIGRNLIGRRLVRASQAALLRVPIVSAVYSPAKQLIEAFSGTGVSGFKRVVLIEYPRVGTWTIALVTSVVKNEAGEIWAVVYVPTAPTPQTGWVALLPISQVYSVNMTVSEAMKFTLSGGIISPGTIRRSPIGDISSLLHEDTKVINNS